LPDHYRFGRIALSPATRQLLIDGQPALLGARAFDLLQALVERSDRLVSKGELLDLVWPGLVVEENNLQVHVSALRKLLGTQAIATVPGRGYRFTMAPAPAPAAAPAPVTAPAPSPRDALPERPVALVGRERELAELLAQLDGSGLVTLVGPGGIGKTTLARAAAQARRQAWVDGVAWVELASLTDASLIGGAVAQALSLQLAVGGDAQAALLSSMKNLQALLVLDNAEHLLDGLAPLVQALQQGAPGLRLLVTSQVPLHLAGERLLRIEALAVPPDGSAAEPALQHGAVALFCERALAVDRRFALTDANVDAVTEICRRLDGVPLALELAAARVPLLGVAGIASRLDDRFRLLASSTRGTPTRQQTLQAALDWSLSLLTPAQRTLFDSLGVFAGGFTLALAGAVLADGSDADGWAAIDGLALLSDHSLVQVGDGDPPRYALSESARAYAQSRLADAPQAHAHALRGRHAQALRAFFAGAQGDWLRMADAPWLALYEPELDNLRTALAWSQQHDPETLVALVGTAAPLWHHLSLHAEARRWHEVSEAMVDDNVPKPLAAAWWRAAQWVWAEASPGRSRGAADHAQTLFRALGDEHGLYAQLTGLAGLWQEPNPAARAALDEALALEQPDWPARERAWGQRARADVARAEGRLADSRAAREVELGLRIAAGDERGAWRARSHLADLALAMGEVDEAAYLGHQLVDSLRGKRAPATLCTAQLNLMHALLVRGSVDEALALSHDALRLAGDCAMLWQAADTFAWLAACRNDLQTAARLAGWADAAYRRRDAPRSALRAQARERVQAGIGTLPATGLDAALDAGARLAEAEIAALWERSRPGG
jgi:predicted ATPase/DNA-binding winged helix-turn-helix (wHTH) protein